MPYSNSNLKEQKLGLELFFTDTPALGGRIKKTPKDFIVTERSLEISRLSPSDLKALADDTIVYTYATVESCNWETNRLIHRFSEILQISYDKIHFAGSKDKRAVTTQLMAFQVPPEQVRNISLPEVKIYNIFQSTRSFKIGDLLGNDFEITIRDMPPDRDANVSDKIMKATFEQLKPINGSPNYFGVQRFGIIRPVTHHIGKLITQKKFEEAVLTYIGHPVSGEPRKDFFARSEFDKHKDLEWSLKNYPQYLIFEKILIKHLLRHPEDYVGALERLPKNLSTMFIHSYQSYLFNRILSERIRSGIPIHEPIIGDIVLPVDDNRLPIHKTWILATEQNIRKLTKQSKKGNAYASGVLFGCNTDLAEGDFGEIEHHIIDSEGLEQDDFINPDYPTLSSKGSRRELLAPVFDFNYSVGIDSVTVKFGLMKGAYATTFLREFMKGDVRDY